MFVWCGIYLARFRYRRSQLPFDEWKRDNTICGNYVRLCRVLRNCQNWLGSQCWLHHSQVAPSGCLFLVDFCLTHIIVHIFIRFLFWFDSFGATKYRGLFIFLWIEPFWRVADWTADQVNYLVFSFIQESYNAMMCAR